MATEGGIRRGSGPWSLHEKKQFENGIVEVGWGNWKDLVHHVPSRTSSQIKSHAQKFRRHRQREFERLQSMHKRRMTAADDDSLAPATPAAVAETPKRNCKSTPARRKSATHKAKRTPTRSSFRSSPRRRSSAFSAVSCKTTLTPKKSMLDTPSFPVKKEFQKTHSSESPGDILADVTSAVRRVNLAESPTISAGLDFSSGFPSPPDPQEEDDLAALVAELPPSSALASMNIDDIMLDDDVLLDEALTIVKDKDANIDAIDTMLQLEVDDDNLDMISDFLDPSWNILATPEAEVEATPTLGAVLHPVAPNPASAPRAGGAICSNSTVKSPAEVRRISTTANAIASSFVSLESSTPLSLGLEHPAKTTHTGAAVSPFSASLDSRVSGSNTAAQQDTYSFSNGERCEIPPGVRPDLRLFLDTRSRLTAEPDFNNPKEYILAEDGSSRMRLEHGSLCRVRVMDMLKEHLDMGWWREEVLADAVGCRWGTMMDEKQSFKKASLEQLVALTAAMLDVDHWQTPREGKKPVGMSSATIAIGDEQRFNDEDDIRHIGQLLSGLWERVNRSLSRDDFFLLGQDGGREGSTARMERYSAINQMVTRLDTISRQEESSNFSFAFVGV